MICIRCLLAGLLWMGLFNTVAAAQDITTGLRGHWRLVETTGTTATDATSTAQDGTYINGVNLAASAAVPTDAAVPANFNGSTHYVSIANAADLQPTTTLTIAGWVRGDSWGSGTDVDTILGKGEANPNNYALAIAGGKVELILDGNDNAGFRGNTVLATGQWYHVAATWNGAEVRIYVNGVLDNTPASRTGTIGADTRAAYIGGRPGADYFDGGLYDVRLYNRALSSTDVAALYNQIGLIAHWKLNQTSGTTATDSSLTANNGTYTNGVGLAATGPYTGLGDKAANFDGSNDYVATSNEFYYDLVGPMAVAAWIKVDVFDTAYQAIVTKGDGAWRLVRSNTSNMIRFQCNGLSTTSVSSNTSVNDGKWHHVAGVYTGSQLQVYVDGVLDNSVAATGAISRNGYNAEIARNAQTSGREFDGQIFDVRVYSVPLSAGKVSELFGFIGHWKLAESSGTTAADSTPFAQNGTVSGGANWTMRCDGSGAFDFNGSSHSISVPSASHLQPTQMLSIAAWIKGNSWGSADSVDAILRKGEGNPNNYQLAIADGKVALYLDGSDTGGTRSTTTLSARQTYHVAGTWDGTTARIYVNGQLETSAARSGTISTDTRPLYIGGRPGADQFDGQIQDVRLYNRPLTNAEIAKLCGVVGHWQFAEGTGTTTADASLQANDATLSGATLTTDCAGYNALAFNGSDGVATTNSAFKPPAEGTVAFWMRSSGNPASTARLFGTGGEWEVRQSTDGKLNFDISGEAGTSAVSTVPLNEAGRWYHVAETYNSADDSYAIYIDGKLDTSGTNTNNLVQQAAAILTFGTRTGSTEYWQGAMRDFRVYSRRLCPAEIAELYGLVGYWRLDESSGPIASDSSGAGNDGAVVGAANWNAGRINNAFQFNGTTSINAPSLLGEPRNATLAAWAKLSAADSGGSEIISLGDSFAIRLDNGTTTRAFFYNGSSWTSVTYNQTFAGGGWHHFAAVFDDDHNFCRLYIDGIERANLSTTGSIVYGLGANTVLGRHGNGSTTFDFTGWIDDARVYNRPLCATEVQRLYSGAGPLGVKIIKWVEIQ